MIFVIRHGERADDGMQNEKVSLDFDPPLTARGVQQGLITGAYIQKFLEKQNITGAIIVTSPFLRCIQTAVAIKRGLVHTPDVIQTSRGLGEFYRENWFTRDVLDDLTLHTPARTAYVQEQQFMEVPYAQVRQQYPENLQEFFGRQAENYQRLKNHFLPSLLAKNMALILVGHGFGIHAIYNLEKCFDYMSHIDYCSISILQYTEKKDKPHKAQILMKNNCEHLVQPHM